MNIICGYETVTKDNIMEAVLFLATAMWREFQSIIYFLVFIGP